MDHNDDEDIASYCGLSAKTRALEAAYEESLRNIDSIMRDEADRRLRVQIILLEHDKDFLQEELTVADERIVDLYDDLALQDEGVDGIHNQLALANDRTEGLHKQLAVADYKIDSLRNQVTLADDQIADLRKQIAVADNKQYIQQKQLVIANDKIEDLRRQVTVADDEVARLRKQLAVADSKQENQHKKLALANDKIDDLHKKLALADNVRAKVGNEQSQTPVRVLESPPGARLAREAGYKAHISELEAELASLRAVKQKKHLKPDVPSIKPVKPIQQKTRPQPERQARIVKAATLLGEKSTFSVTPFLNRTVNIIDEEEEPVPEFPNLVETIAAPVEKKQPKSKPKRKLLGTLFDVDEEEQQLRPKKAALKGAFGAFSPLKKDRRGVGASFL